MIKGKSRREAIGKAQKEANDYAMKITCVNPYHQKIATECLNVYDIYELKVNPGDKTEIFSMTRMMSRRIPNSKVVRIYIGKRQHHYGKGKWKKFVNRDYNP